MKCIFMQFFRWILRSRLTLSACADRTLLVILKIFYIILIYIYIIVCNSVSHFHMFCDFNKIGKSIFEIRVTLSKLLELFLHLQRHESGLMCFLMSSVTLQFWKSQQRKDLFCVYASNFSDCCTRSVFSFCIQWCCPTFLWLHKYRDPQSNCHLNR